MEKIVEVMVTEERLEESEINKNLLSNLLLNKIKPSEFVLGDKEKLVHKIQERFVSDRNKQNKTIHSELDHLLRNKKEVKLVFSFPNESDMRHYKKVLPVPTEIPAHHQSFKRRREGQNFSKLNKNKKEKPGQREVTLKSLAKGVIALNFWDRLRKKNSPIKEEEEASPEQKPNIGSMEKIELLSNLDPSDYSHSHSNSMIFKSPTNTNANTHQQNHSFYSGNHNEIEPNSASLKPLEEPRQKKKISFLNIFTPKNKFSNNNNIAKALKEAETPFLKQTPKENKFGSLLSPELPKSAFPIKGESQRKSFFLLRNIDTPLKRKKDNPEDKGEKYNNIEVVDLH